MAKRSQTMARLRTRLETMGDCYSLARKVDTALEGRDRKTQQSSIAWEMGVEWSAVVTLLVYDRATIENQGRFRRWLAAQPTQKA